MTASSTTTPSATTSPPSVIVLRLRPNASRIQTVVSSASGIELNDTSAPRQSRSVTSSSATTSTAPISSELRSFSIALSMKLAGRSSAGWYSTPCFFSDGASASRRASSARVTSSVFAPNCVEVSTRMPGSVADHRVAETRLGAVADRRDIAEAHRHAVARRRSRLRQRFGRRAGGLRLHDDALRRGLDVAAADQLGRTPRRLRDVVERESVRRELQRIDLHLPLAHFAAEDLRLRDAGHGEDLRLDDPLRRDRAARAATASSLVKPKWTRYSIDELSGDSCGGLDALPAAGRSLRRDAR